MSGLRRDLQAMCAEGATWSAMVGLGESYLPAFVLAMSASQLATGLVATIPLLLGALLQLSAPWGVAWLRSYRRWVILCAVTQSLAFLPLITMALLGRISLLWTFLAASVYWAANLGMGPAWNAWAESLVPRRLRSRFFARRAKVGQLGLLLGFVAGGLILQWGTQYGWKAQVFALLFLGAALSRLTSIHFLRIQGEPLFPESSNTAIHRLLLTSGRANLAGPVLRFVLVMQMATWVAGPYFTPYMLIHLNLSYLDFTLLTCTVFLTKILVLPLVGDVCHRVGTVRVMASTGLLAATVPMLWLVSNNLVYLFAIQAFSGIVWAGFELATLLLFFEKIPIQQRVATLALFNLANAVAIVAGSCLGAVVLMAFGGTLQAYLVLFSLSGAARAVSLLALGQIRVPRLSSWQVVTRSLVMAPGVGSIERPVLAASEAKAGCVCDLTCLVETPTQGGQDQDSETLSALVAAFEPVEVSDSAAAPVPASESACVLPQQTISEGSDIPT